MTVIRAGPPLESVLLSKMENMKEYGRFDEEDHGLSRRPKSKRNILIAVVVALVAFFTVVLVLAIALGVTLNRGSVYTNYLAQLIIILLLIYYSGCGSTLECLASSVRSNMDTSVNPCEDFYQFSCGGWERRHTISPTAISFTRFGELNQQNINSLRNVIESGKDGNVPAVRLAKQFYDACMNTRLLDEMGSQPLLQLVRATGGWDLIGASNSKYM